MSRLFLLCIIFLLGCRNYVDSVGSLDDKSDVKTDTPIIGVLAQEISWHLDQQWPGAYESYIAASYIKFVEGGGARAVPIWIGKDRSYYEVMLQKVNGILLPGGGTWFNQSQGYAVAGTYIYNIAQQMNDNGIYFPLFGTCLGFELLVYNSNQNQEYRTKCSSECQSLPLEFSADFRNSQIFGNAPEVIIDILKNEPVTPNFHIHCLTQQNLSAFGLDEQWKVLSYNQDFNDLEFISSIEHKRYPFFGVQFHPEKILYEWVRNRNISHTENAVASAQYFATFFVNECRKNGNQFDDISEENRMLIYNFPATFTGLINSSFEQSYLFKKNPDYPNDDDESKEYEISRRISGEEQF